MTEERLLEQKNLIEKVLKSKLFNKYEGVYISGNNSNILKSIMGELRNIHLAVFKKRLGKNLCEHCHVEERLDRAHTKSRPEIGKEVLDRIHTNPSELLDMNLFMKEFVSAHTKVGVWMLCKKCHKELG